MAEPSTEPIERAREDVQRATGVTDDDTVREQLRSIDEGLKEMTHSPKEDASPTDRRHEDGDATTEGDVPHGEKLQQVEEKLVALGDETEGRARALVQDARNRLDEYRRRYTQDW